MKNKRVWLSILAAVLIIGICVLCVFLNRKTAPQTGNGEKGDCVAQSQGSYEAERRENFDKGLGTSAMDALSPIEAAGEVMDLSIE